jgi:hypothetical protein
MSGEQKTVGYTAKGVVVQMPNGCQRGEYQPELKQGRKFYKVLDEWLGLSDDKREATSNDT